MRTCTMPECDRPFRARGLCVNHWNEQHRKRTRYTITCATCGIEHVTSRSDGTYCSLWCRDAEARRNRSLPVLWVRPKWDKREVHQPTVSTTERTWVAGRCRQCQASFIDRQITAVFCSPRCARSWHRKAWKQKTGRTIPDITRALVYERDAGVCQLCFEMVDMNLGPEHRMGPTLDHIVCQSWTLITDHSASNLRLAHRLCNSVRSDERYITRRMVA